MSELPKGSGEPPTILTRVEWLEQRDRLTGKTFEGHNTRIDNLADELHDQDTRIDTLAAELREQGVRHRKMVWDVGDQLREVGQNVAALRAEITELRRQLARVEGMAEGALIALRGLGGAR